MKKILLLLLFPIIGFSQNQFAFGFDGTTAAMISAGWQVTNQSSPVYATAPTWSIADYTAPTATTPFGGLTPNGQAGGLNSFALINYTSTGTSSTAGSGTISNWLITPVVNVQNGDVVTFYTRIGKNTTTADPNASFADRLQLRMSTTGSTTTNPTGGSAGLGDFTTLLDDVNPNLNLTDYPTSWATGLRTVTISGLSGPTDVKFAFRYFVTSGGPAGNNSDIIGIDSFSVDRPVASAQSFFTNNFSIYPNPANNVLNLSVKNGLTVNEISVVDINGRTVKTINNSFDSEMEINVSDLTSGVYMLNVKTEEGVATSKFVKN
ncbi:choice-of-anchor J domain-containing protein [uncultured Flavobacterium sp.]|uniref:T9SS-dependent choice-of-anchor J family protein n=1 Tax=uncultured Flavobacterium sp. TaxID=165435 RepID=UPI0030C8412C